MRGELEKIVYLVHCVDAEGPLHEDLAAKFQRLAEVYGVEVAPSPENLARLRRGEIDLGGKELAVRQALSSHLATFMDSWPRLEQMLDRSASPSFRQGLPDSFGQGHVYNWFVLDHVGYLENPRRRTLGYLAIFDFYREFLARPGQEHDGLHWHFHFMSTYRQAHRCATSLLNSPHIWEGLARRIIDRGWFPSCCRSAFQTERPDSHWFLEQYIPFDFTNTAVEDPGELEAQADLAGGRFGDWRLAPNDWSVYQPSHDNYQRPGHCRRWIARTLNLLNRFASLDQTEVDKAFTRAASGQPTVLGVAGHDFRDLASEVEHLRRLLRQAMARFPGVKLKYCEAAEAMRAVIPAPEPEQLPLRLALELERDSHGRPTILEVRTVQGQVFGPQPFLALKTRSQGYLHDNLDLSLDGRSWRYVFDTETVLPGDLAAVGVGAADGQGNTAVEVINLEP